MKVIRVEITIPGKGVEAHEYEYCPIYFAAENEGDICPLGGMVCKYGLTNIVPPDTCPIVMGRGIEMHFTIVDSLRK